MVPLPPELVLACVVVPPRDDAFVAPAAAAAAVAVADGADVAVR